MFKLSNSKTIGYSYAWSVFEQDLKSFWLLASSYPYESAKWWNNQDELQENKGKKRIKADTMLVVCVSRILSDVNEIKAMIFNVVAVYEAFLDQREHYDGSIIYDDLIANPRGEAL